MNSVTLWGNLRQESGRCLSSRRTDNFVDDDQRYDDSNYGQFSVLFPEPIYADVAEYSTYPVAYPLSDDGRAVDEQGEKRCAEGDEHDIQMSSVLSVFQHVFRPLHHG